jgi:hypothetical protein
MWNVLAGANITITTSTPGQLSVAVVASPTLTNLTLTGTLSVAATSTLATSTITSLSLGGIPVKPTFDKSFNLSSTTPDYLGNSFKTATYTIPSIYNPSYAVTLTKLYCKTDTGTVLLNFGGNTLSCTSSGASSTPSTNIAVEANVAASIGTAASSPNWVTVTATWKAQ